MAFDISEEQLERYSRNILLKQVGLEGQQKICRSRILVIGAGGLGAPASLYLAAAGVGHIGILDSDKVELSNLQRQVIHFTRDIGAAKAESAAAKMREINPDIRVQAYNLRIDASNARRIISEYDFIIDGTDNFAAKFLINDACVLEKKPFSHGGILRFDGQTITVVPGVFPCYRCVFSSPPPRNLVPTCSQAGILGAVAGILGSIQAAEALKYVIGSKDLLTGRFLIFNALTMEFRKAAVGRNPACPVCGENAVIRELKDEEQPACDLKPRRECSG